MAGDPSKTGSNPIGQANRNSGGFGCCHKWVVHGLSHQTLKYLLALSRVKNWVRSRTPIFTRGLHRQWLKTAATHKGTVENLSANKLFVSLSGLSGPAWNELAKCPRLLFNSQNISTTVVTASPNRLSCDKGASKRKVLSHSLMSVRVS